jgi:hypothetical protein
MHYIVHGSCAAPVCCFAPAVPDRVLAISAVPKVFREALVGAGWSVGRSPVHHAVTATDGTTKVCLGSRATEDELSAL